MNKLLTLAAAAALGISMVGCAENKPAAPPANTNATPPGPSGGEAKPEGGAAPTEPAPAPTEEKK